MCLFAKCYTRASEQVSVEQVCIARHGFRERIHEVGVMVEEIVFIAVNAYSVRASASIISVARARALSFCNGTSCQS